MALVRRLSAAPEAIPSISGSSPTTAADAPLYPSPPPVLPPLSTQGPYILKPDCSAIALRGVNVVGFDSVTSVAAAPAALALDGAALNVLSQIWKLTVVRIPLQAQSVVKGTTTLSSVDVLAALDSIVAQLAASGLYAQLAIEAESIQGEPPQPDNNIIAALDILATRFATNGTVLYEIFSTSSPLSSEWPQSAQLLIGTVRRHAPAAMILVNTGNRGVDYANFPLQFPTGEPVFNLVYTIQAAAGSEPEPQEGALAALAETHPLCASLWTDDTLNVSPFVADLLGRYGIHWIASNWNADPTLVSDAAGHDFITSPWGLVVQRAAAYPLRSYLLPILSPQSSSSQGSPC